MKARGAVAHDPLPLGDLLMSLFGSPGLFPPQPPMSDTANQTDHTEALRAPSDAVIRRYIVKIEEVTVFETHVQNWRSKGKRADGSDPHGYVTTVTPVKESRTIFEGEFTTRPSIAALATLLESSG